MKKLLVVLSLVVFVGAFAAPVVTMAQEKPKTTTVAQDKKATKAEAKAAKTEAKACCSEGAKSNCATTCTEAAACCKGEGMKAKEEKKK